MELCGIGDYPELFLKKGVLLNKNYLSCKIFARIIFSKFRENYDGTQINNRI